MIGRGTYVTSDPLPTVEPLLSNQAEIIKEISEKLPPSRKYPGALIVVEGIDGSGKSTQLYLLKRWLEINGYRLHFTEWNSSPLVKSATRRGKQRRLLTPTTFSLLHAADFADRCERKWQLAFSALAIAIFGLLFSQQTSAVGIMVVGVLIAFSNTVMAYSFHAYQSDLAAGQTEFRFENVPPGSYWLSVVHKPERNNDHPAMYALRPIAARSLTVEPGAISRRTRSPCSIFSPSSGSLNSITALVPFLSRV